MRLSTAAAALSLFSAAPACAEATAAQRAVCTPDVWRLCAPEIPNVDGIRACLRRERARLSTRCGTVVDDADRGVRTAKAGTTGPVARN